jgi:hypothetical protein
MPRANQVFWGVFRKEIKAVIDEKHVFQESLKRTVLILMVKIVV